ncbi:MAG: oligoribonuclease [bacterium]|nr:oligoribonuclease [bacterium]
MPNSDPDTNLVWIDLEMTGLDWNVHRILEIACIVTNCNLEILEEGPQIVIHQPEKLLGTIDSETKSHIGLDLIEQSQKSTVSEKEAEQRILELVKKHCHPGKGVVCGNGIYIDRAFLFQQMQELNGYLYYRNIDVTSLKELYKRWRPGEALYVKMDNHRALDDIKDSIAELKYYRQVGFIIGADAKI